jgi:tetratricopeptide (TPR) repeat protein
MPLPPNNSPFAAIMLPTPRRNNLATLLQDTDHLVEAESMMRRALAIDEKSYGLEDPNVAIRLSNLATLLQATNRLADAEPLVRRALAIEEKSYGPEHPSVAISLSVLASLLVHTNRQADAEPLIRRAVAIFEKAYGPDHPDVASSLNNLAQLLEATNRKAEAEPLMRRALAIDEKSFGPEHPKVAIRLNNLALLFEATSRLAEGEPLMRRALAIDEQSYGAGHPRVGQDLNNLTVLREEQDDWPTAAELCLRAKPIMIGANAPRQMGSWTMRKAVLAQNTGGLRNCARALHRVNVANLGDGFVLAQWALQNTTADALSSMSARFAKGDTKLARLVREQTSPLNNRVAKESGPSCLGSHSERLGIAIDESDP